MSAGATGRGLISIIFLGLSLLVLGSFFLMVEGIELTLTRQVLYYLSHSSSGVLGSYAMPNLGKV
jgi:uncharacterized membrane protein YvlD (DUF360 family)